MNLIRKWPVYVCFFLAVTLSPGALISLNGLVDREGNSQPLINGPFVWSLLIDDTLDSGHVSVGRENGEWNFEMLASEMTLSYLGMETKFQSGISIGLAVPGNIFLSLDVYSLYQDRITTHFTLGLAWKDVGMINEPTDSRSALAALPSLKKASVSTVELVSRNINTQETFANGGGGISEFTIIPEPTVPALVLSLLPISLRRRRRP